MKRPDPTWAGSAMIRAQRFYDEIYRKSYEATNFAYSAQATKHPHYKTLNLFVEANGLRDARCLEIGTGRGAFQDLVDDYYGMDLARVAGEFMRKPFAIASATDLPFRSSRFGGLWTTHVLEHIDRPEATLEEIWRVLRPGGCAYVAASWQCGPWMAQGYQVRPYSSFDWTGKLIKATVPLRKSVWFRALHVFPLRLASILRLLRGRPARLWYRELEPNLDELVGPDSSAASSIDAFEVWLWFRSRGAACLNYPTALSGLFIRTGPLTFRKPGPQSEGGVRDGG